MALLGSRVRKPLPDSPRVEVPLKPPAHLKYRLSFFPNLSEEGLVAPLFMSGLTEPCLEATKAFFPSD